MLHATYPARELRFEPIRLGRLPVGTVLHAGHNFWVEHAGRLAIEQVNPLIGNWSALHADIAKLPFGSEKIAQPCVLAARYGDVTWGHWVGEILPRIVIAEAMYPGRFSFAMNANIIDPTIDGGYATAVLQSLGAYGINQDRLIGLRADRHYHFDTLFAVADIWSVAGIHPTAIDVMRSRLPKVQTENPGRKLAILRRDASTRNIANLADIEQVLDREGYTIADPARLSFQAQADLFRTSDDLFGVLGSGLIGLMFAPDNVRVASVAPGSWPDAYFHIFMQHRNASYADLRGPALWTGEGLERDAPFLVVPSHFESALMTLSQPESVQSPGGMTKIGDVTIPRRLGQTLADIDFAEAGKSQLYQREGWSFQEPQHVWAVGPRSVIVLPDVDFAAAALLELDVFALTDQSCLIARRLEVFLNGTSLGGADIAAHATISLVILPGCLLAGATNILEFHHPHCLSPRALGFGDDDRPLAFAFKRLRLRASATKRI
ncbi:glycosyltransferase family 61 protein [Acidiphilium iwatense]|nr:glycosyltransferase family 61 protein [Acidiphilium iwatense]